MFGMLPEGGGSSAILPGETETHTKPTSKKSDGLSMSAFAPAANFMAFARVRRGSLSMKTWSNAPSKGHSALFLRDMGETPLRSEPSSSRSPSPEPASGKIRFFCVNSLDPPNSTCCIHRCRTYGPAKCCRLCVGPGGRDWYTLQNFMPKSYP